MARALDRLSAGAQHAARRAGGPEPTAAAPAPGGPDLSDATAMFLWCRDHGVRTRPQYLWPVLLGARLARALEIPRISCLEFGVAGGNGLLALERAAAAATSLTGVDIDVIGFDVGTGMPEPVDHRDVPWVIQPGYFSMDEAALRNRLERAELVLGPVRDTVPAWMSSGDAAPIGFCSFDLDYYSSTMHAFGVLEGSAARLLPRVPCYFDDMFGYGWNEFNGERAAIIDFNSAHEQRKIAKIPGLRYLLPPSDFMLPWHDQLYVVHAFDHPQYNTWEGPVAAGWFDAHRLQPDS